MVLKLQFSAQAWNRHIQDPSNREPIGGIWTIRTVWSRRNLPSRSVVVEGDGMQIDLPAIV